MMSVASMRAALRRSADVRARALICTWSSLAVVAGLILGLLPHGPQRVGLDVMWVVALGFTAGFGAMIVHDRVAISTDRDLATVWVTIGLLAPVIPTIFRSWVACGIGLLVLGYAIVLRRRAGIVADQALLRSRERR